jgi:hypothetical protein
MVVEPDAARSKPPDATWINGLLAGAIVALLLAMFFLPWFLPHRHPPQRACLANLKSIEAAKRVWGQEHGKTTNDTPTEADLYGRDK